MSKTDNERKTAFEKLFGKKEKKHPPTSREINQVVKAQKDSAMNIGKLVHKVQEHQQKAAVSTHDLSSEIRNIKNIEKKRQKLTNEYIEHQKCDTYLPPLSAQLALEETSLPSYSQVPTGKEKNSPSAPLYPKLNGTLEKAMPVSVTSESSESTTFEPLYKSCVDRAYDRIARQWEFEDKKTKEENIDIIQQKVAVLEEQVDWKYPSEEEEIELEAGKKLAKTLPTIITSLNANKNEKEPSTGRILF